MFCGYERMDGKRRKFYFAVFGLRVNRNRDRAEEAGREGGECNFTKPGRRDQEAGPKQLAPANVTGPPYVMKLPFIHLPIGPSRLNMAGTYGVILLYCSRFANTLRSILYYPGPNERLTREYLYSRPLCVKLLPHPVRRLCD